MPIPLVFSDFQFARFTPDRQFHILKHLQSINMDYKEYLMENSLYTSEDIEKQLNLHGSKFSVSFCDNPQDLFDVLTEEFQMQQIESYWSGNRCEFQMRFSRADYPKGIGEDRILHIDEVPDFIKEPFVGKDIETLHRIIYKTDPKPTWMVNIILQIISGQPEIMSIFPGIYAPPFPNREEQDEVQYLVSMNFWCRHIIIA